MSVKEIGEKLNEAVEAQEKKEKLQLKTIDIKGKEYVLVNERIKAFWKLYPNGRLETEIVSIQDGMCIMRAYAYKDTADEKPSSTGTAYEREQSSFINKRKFY